MLTRDDRTVADALSLVEPAVAAGARHIGFKDIGAPPRDLARLAQAITAGGAQAYLEIVDPDPTAAEAAASLAREIGINHLMGGVAAAAVLRILGDSGIAYYPFAGLPVGHPTRLEGSAQRISEDCRRFAALGCAGIDLLAYRSIEAEPMALILAARAATAGRLIVAGNIDSSQRIADLAEAGVDAFTVGTAALNQRFAPGAGVARQMELIAQACQAASGQRPARKMRPG